jgi:hypothetical protein
MVDLLTQANGTLLLKRTAANSNKAECLSVANVASNRSMKSTAAL